MKEKENPYSGAVWFHITTPDQREQITPIIERQRREHPNCAIVETHTLWEMLRAIRLISTTSKPQRLICVEHDLPAIGRWLLNKRGVEVRYYEGDTRFDSAEAVVTAQQEDEIVAAFIGNTSRIIVAGSTSLNDEVLLTRYIDEHEDTKLIVIPHNPDAPHMQGLFQLTHGHMIRYTEATPTNIQTNRILVVEPTLLRAKLYRYAHAAYIGGGFDGGLHNAIEACAWGKPVLYGPKHTNRAEGQVLINCGAGVSIKNYTEFSGAMDEALSAHEEIGKKARHFVVENLVDETNKIYNELMN